MKAFTSIYAQICVFVLVLLAVLGVGAPYLISYNDDLVVWLGMILLLAVPVAVIWFVRHIYKQIKQQLGEKNEKQE